ncbi:protein of unknown function [Acidithiobacillus ferrivorans]|uniref:Uncharacterized protein n=1 Tax=Acidithiobacillus ferrivorans TaxID=160808 RepID=A0ABY1MV61_9PROT|nr:protein of unknown function [Acidithiobacillus ferrivorans]
MAQAVQYGSGGLYGATLLYPGNPSVADSTEEGQFLTAQTLGAPSSLYAEARLLRGDFFAVTADEVAEERHSGFHTFLLDTILSSYGRKYTSINCHIVPV